MTFIKAWALGNDSKWHVYQTEGDDFEWLADGYSSCDKQVYRVAGVKKAPPKSADICHECWPDARSGKA